jgi:kynurenine 3-monooxygenase
MSKSVTILGAGLVGSLWGVIMAKKGYDVTIYERRPDMRKANIGAGKSINLAMSNRGWKAIELAGLRKEIEAIAIPMTGRFLHQKDGTTAFQAYGKNDEAIYSVSRGELNKKLMDLAEQVGVKIHFEHKCVDVDIHTNTITLENADGIRIVAHTPLLFGADGAHSSLRQAFTLIDRVNSSRHYIDCGYKELYIPARQNNSFLIEKNALHIWPRGKYMMIALANFDGSFTCTLFLQHEGQPSFQAVQSDEEIKTFFETEFADAVPLMPTLLEDYKNNPIGSLITTRISQYAYKGTSCLIGDAAHAIVPFYGQGMNAGFEDCTILYQLMEQYDDDWERIFATFNEIRPANGNAVADLALANFIEMRDKVADPKFLERKQIEKELGKMYPSDFNSVYEMVSFSQTPYVVATVSTVAQDELLHTIMEQGDFQTNIQNADFKVQLEALLKAYNDNLNAKLAHTPGAFVL